MPTEITYGSVSMRYGDDNSIKTNKNKLFAYEFAVGLTNLAQNNEEGDNTPAVSTIDDVQLYLAVPIRTEEGLNENALLILPSLSRVELFVKEFFDGNVLQTYNQDQRIFNLPVSFMDTNDEKGNYNKRIISHLKIKQGHLASMLNEGETESELCLAESGLIKDEQANIAIDGRTHIIRVDRHGRVIEQQEAAGAAGNAAWFNGHSTDYYLNPTYDQIIVEEIAIPVDSATPFIINRGSTEQKTNKYILSDSTKQDGIKGLTFQTTIKIEYDIFTIESSEDNTCVVALKNGDSAIYIRPGDAYKIRVHYDQETLQATNIQILEYLPGSSRVNGGAAGITASNASLNSVLLGNIETNDNNNQKPIELINIGFGNKVIAPLNSEFYPKKAAVFANDAYILRDNEVVLSSHTFGNTKIQSGTISFVGDSSDDTEWKIPCYANATLNGEFAYNILIPGETTKVQSGTISFVVRSANGVVSLIDHYTTTEMSSDINEGIDTPTLNADDGCLIFSTSGNKAYAISVILNIKNETIEIKS